MLYEVVQSRNAMDEWRVEAIDADGQVAVALFTGPTPEARAREYAAWKNAQEGAPAAQGKADA